MAPPQSFKEIFLRLEREAVKKDVEIEKFWDMTLREIVLTLEVRREQDKLEAQERAALIYILADLNGASVGRLMGAKTKYPPIYEIFPHLFDKPTMQEPEQQDWRIAKERLMRYAEAHNRKRGGKRK